MTVGTADLEGDNREAVDEAVGSFPKVMDEGE